MTEDAKPAAVQSQGEGALARRVHQCGSALLAVYAILVPISFAIAAAAPFGAHQPLEAAVLEGWANSVPLPAQLRAQVVDVAWGRSVFASALARGVCFGGLMAAATAIVCTLLLSFARRRAEIDARIVELLFRYGLGFAALNLCAYPMFTHDFWMSIAWGRMAAEGINPYQHTFTAASLAGLPLEDFGKRMTYGPLWAGLSAAYATVLPRSAFLEYAAHKITLGAFWVLGLFWLRRIHAEAPAYRQAAALLLFGWLPLSVHLAVAEAHLDIAMMSLMLGWLWLLQRRSAWAAAPLMASVVLKYVTAPLLALELYFAVRKFSGARLMGFLVSGVLAAALVVALSDGGSIFSSAAEMAGWRTLTPVHALHVAGGLLDFPPLGRFADLVVLGLLFAGVWPALRRFVESVFRSREQHFDDVVEVVLWAMLCASLVFVGHTWPWFLLWPLVAAAANPASRLLGWILPILLLAPFFQLLWAAGRWSDAGPLTLALYVASVLLVWPVRRWLRPALV